MQYEQSKLSPTVRRYAVALWALALATLLSLTFVHFFGWHRGIVFPYLIAILAAAWWGGYIPGLLSALLAALFAPYLLTSGYSIDKMDWPRLVLISVVSLLTSRMAASRAETERKLRSLNDALDERVRLRTRELEQANAALRESDRRLGLALEAGRMGVWEWHIADGRVTWSPQLEAMHGLAPGTFEGTFEHFRREIHPDDRERVLTDIEQAIAGRAEYHTEYKLRRPEGSMIWVETRGKLICDANGEPERMVGVCMEITARREAAEALQAQTDELARSNADLQQFAYVASHDLQEPLRMVASYTQLLIRKFRSHTDPDADSIVGYVVEGVTRMETLIRDLLNYSRVIHGSQGNAEPLPLADAIQRALVNLESSIRETEAIIVIEPMPDLAGDQSHLSQVFQNLIGNALKYRGKEPPRIHISVSRDGALWCFHVRDNGIGIAEAYQQSIFAPFKRLHGRDYPGNGIGLAICQRVIERQGGRIWVQSSSDEGTEFAFTLPVPAQRAANGGSH